MRHLNSTWPCFKISLSAECEDWLCSVTASIPLSLTDWVHFTPAWEPVTHQSLQGCTPDGNRFLSFWHRLLQNPGKMPTSACFKDRHLNMVSTPGIKSLVSKDFHWTFDIWKNWKTLIITYGISLNNPLQSPGTWRSIAVHCRNL